ncbi:unnamed protein product [Urochloa humidicola]
MPVQILQGFVLQFDWIYRLVKRCLSCAMTSPFEIAGVQDFKEKRKKLSQHQIFGRKKMLELHIWVCNECRGSKFNAQHCTS